MNVAISSSSIEPSATAVDPSAVRFFTTSLTWSSVSGVARNSASSGTRSGPGTPSGYPARSQLRIEPSSEVVVTTKVSWLGDGNATTGSTVRPSFTPRSSARQPSRVPACEGGHMTTASAPDGTAVRVALWRALHVEVDPPPHVLDDTVGLRLADPDPDWRARGDMDPDGTRAFRASIVARARFLDDLVRELAAGGVGQYVILGAGLDSFAQRRSDSALQIYEVDQPGTQEWKRRRLTEEGYPLPESLHFVPVDFESGQPWPE